MADHFNTPPVPGEHVTGYSDGPGYTATWSGTYLGVVHSDHDGTPIHFFAGGEINGTAQGCHGFPADPSLPCRDVTSGVAIQAWRSSRDLTITGRFVPSPGDATKPCGPDLIVDPSDGADEECPACGASEDLAMWAEDGEAWAADYYSCPVCGASGYVVHPPTPEVLLMEAEEMREMLSDDDPAGHPDFALHHASAAVTRLLEEGRISPGMEETLQEELRIAHRFPARADDGSREVLMHLNLTVAADDGRTAEQIAAVVMAALEVGMEGAPEEVPMPTRVEMAMVEEV